jgi:hypothetical protein
MARRVHSAALRAIILIALAVLARASPAPRDCCGDGSCALECTEGCAAAACAACCAPSCAGVVCPPPTAQCKVVGTCSGAGVCAAETAAPDNTVCDDAGAGDGLCAAGACVAACSVTTCPSTECTDPGACSGAGACAPAIPKADTTPCGVAGAGACIAGACVPRIDGLAASGLFGSSVSLSGDGRTLVVGAPTANSNAGAAYVVTKSGGAWGAPVALATAATPSSEFGTSVAIARDGLTLVIGAPAASQEASQVWVSRFVGGAWAPATLLAAKSPAYLSKFGAAVAISADGALVVAGAPNTGGGGNYRGQAFAYTYAASAWTEDLLGSGASNFYKIGTSVAVAEDGTNGAVAVVAAYDQAGSTGAVYVAARPAAGSWGALTQVAGGSAGGDYFGSDVAISADGFTVLIGAAGQNGDVGGAYTMTAAGGGAWNAPVALAGAGLGFKFGFSVALSADAAAALGFALEGGGAVSRADYSGSSWSALARVGDGAGSDTFGTGLAASADGAVVAVGAPGYASTTGAVFVLE